MKEKANWKDRLDPLSILIILGFLISMSGVFISTISPPIIWISLAAGGYAIHLISLASFILVSSRKERDAKDKEKHDRP